MNYHKLQTLLIVVVLLVILQGFFLFFTNKKISDQAVHTIQETSVKQENIEELILQGQQRGRENQDMIKEILSHQEILKGLAAKCAE